MRAQILQTVMGTWGPYNGNSTNRHAQLSTQMAQTVTGNGGLYSGSNTNRRAKMNAHMAQTVMENAWLYNGNSTNSRHRKRTNKVFQRLFSTIGTGKGRNNNGPILRCPPK